MAKAKKNRQAPARGASDSTVSWHAQFDAWRSHHKESARDSLQRILRAPLQNILTALVIGITLALPTLLTLAIQDIQHLGNRWDGSPRLSIFMKHGTTDTAILSVQTALQKNNTVARITLISPEQGLQDFESQVGLSNTLDMLDENPLPALLIAEFTPGTSPERIAQAQAQWQQLPHIDSVDADLAWVQKLIHIMQLGQRLTILLASLLGLGALLSVGNTIRLAIENRRAEIVVAKLVGATDAFVRRPFLYSGFWYGLSGGAVAVVLVFAGYTSLAEPVRTLAALYQSAFQLQGIDGFTAGGLLLTGIVLGVLGAWLAVGQHLHDMRPR